jgi:hypothetical protein
MGDVKQRELFKRFKVRLKFGAIFEKQFACLICCWVQQMFSFQAQAMECTTMSGSSSLLDMELWMHCK